MVWLFALAILVLLLFSQRFRIVALVLLVASVGIGVFFYLGHEYEQKEALARISPAELTFENVLLKPYYSTYKLVGRVTIARPAIP